ncbi:IS91 family transposase [bacterium]|nr:IS91 family transposase [bacterium]
MFRRYGDAYRACFGPHPPEQARVMRAIELCRTAALGGHVDRCDHCGHEAISYNSCRNRHCPKCQSLAKAAWLEARRAELLPVEYYHVVFTLPDQLAPLALQNKGTVYNILFQAAAHSLLQIGADPRHLGADLGLVAVLHTWGQNLMHHPHLHCIVPGGGLSPDGLRWVGCRPGFFLPVRVLSARFRTLFLDLLRRAAGRSELAFHGGLKHLERPEMFEALLEECGQIDWVVYAKPPFGGPEKVLDYLGRYTHRIAISNHRLLGLQDGRVSFTWKNYKRDGRRQTMTLEATELIRRFLLHTLPGGFVRIRFYGLLANVHRAAKLGRCRKLLGVTPAPKNTDEGIEKLDWLELLRDLTGRDPLACPKCEHGRLVRIQMINPTSRGNPEIIARVDSS